MVAKKIKFFHFAQIHLLLVQSSVFSLLHAVGHVLAGLGVYGDSG
jgi:hypothetical protein